ncbi:MAG: molybdopterin-binding protein [Anaerolineales bacterium]|nr:MAG: molybdopterin-binding protein [Anaerolineales bacterium]
MRLEERAVSAARGTILAHNVADNEGRRVLKKGTLLKEENVERLAQLGHSKVMVAVLHEDDVLEDEAALALAAALQTDDLRQTRVTGGRVNLAAKVDGLLKVDADRLLELNIIPGITLATVPPGTVVGPRQSTAQVATLKIIPYAVPRDDLERALAVARPRPGIVELRPLPVGRRAALLLTGESAAHEKVYADFVPPTRTRLERLGAALVWIEAVPQEVAAIRQAAKRLAADADLLIVAGQTSIMDEDDVTPRALREAGAEVVVHGAPVEPGNLLSLAYFPNTPVLCAPGCARGLSYNVVDIVLPHLLLGDRLERADVAALGLGGLLVKTS